MVRSLLAAEIPRGSRHNPVTSIFILHVTRVVTLSVEELETMSKKKIKITAEILARLLTNLYRQ